MLARNLRSQRGEIALIGRDGATVVPVDPSGHRAPDAAARAPRVEPLPGAFVVAEGTP